VSRTRASDEPPKPCGLTGFCPLINEHRLFSEDQIVLIEAGLPVSLSYLLLGIALKKWCRRHGALALRPDFVHCREVLARATREYAAAPEPERSGSFVRSLGRDLKEREAAQAKPFVTPIADAALDRTDPAPF